MDSIMMVLYFVSMMVSREAYLARDWHDGINSDDYWKSNELGRQEAIVRCTAFLDSFEKRRTVDVIAPDPLGMYICRWANWAPLFNADAFFAPVADDIKRLKGLMYYCLAELQSEGLFLDVAMSRHEDGKMVILKDCPQWLVVGSLSRGGASHWTGANATVELFAPDEELAPTHMHWYVDQDTALRLYKEEKELREHIPATIVTVSFTKQ